MVPFHLFFDLFSTCHLFPKFSSCPLLPFSSLFLPFPFIYSPFFRSKHVTFSFLGTFPPSLPSLPSLLYLSLLSPRSPCSQTVHILSSLSACSISLPAEWKNREMNELAFMPPCVSSSGGPASTPPPPRICCRAPAKVNSVERKPEWSSGGGGSLRALSSSCDPCW